MVLSNCHDSIGFVVADFGVADDVDGAVVDVPDNPERCHQCDLDLDRVADAVASATAIDHLQQK